jgi:hypothetical protein
MRDVNQVLSREPLGESTSAQTPGTGRAWIVAATVIGTTIEWYDFFIYGTAAALVFNKVFFPRFDAAAGTIAAFATFAIVVGEQSAILSRVISTFIAVLASRGTGCCASQRGGPRTVPGAKFVVSAWRGT